MSNYSLFSDEKIPAEICNASGRLLANDPLVGGGRTLADVLVYLESLPLDTLRHVLLYGGLRLVSAGRKPERNQLIIHAVAQIRRGS